MTTIQRMFTTLLTLSACVLTYAALAQTSVTNAGDIAASPWVAFLAPYINLIVTSLIGVFVPILAAKFYGWMGIKAQDDAIVRLRQVCQTYAGGLLAKAEDNLANKTFHTGSPEVATITRMIVENVPNVLSRSGLDADAVARMALGEIGKIQALATTTIVDPPKDAPPAAAPARMYEVPVGSDLRSPWPVGVLALALALAGCNYTAQQRADLNLTLDVARQVGRDVVQIYCAASGIIYVVAKDINAKSRVAVNLGKNAALATDICPLINNPTVQVVTQAQASTLGVK